MRILNLAWNTSAMIGIWTISGWLGWYKYIPQLLKSPAIQWTANQVQQDIKKQIPGVELKKPVSSPLPSATPSVKPSVAPSVAPSVKPSPTASPQPYGYKMEIRSPLGNAKLGVDIPSPWKSK